MKEQEPKVFREVRCFVLPKDYIHFKPTGIAATDTAGTLLFDVTKGVWSSEILEAFSISPSILPKVGTHREEAGYVTKQASKETHLPAVYTGEQIK
jgi:xylulokinase